MVLKYNFSNIDTTGNMFADVLIFTNSNTHNLLVYAMIVMIFGILMYVYVKKTDDIGGSFLRAMFASTLLSIIFYYMGKYINATYSVDISLFSGSILIAMILIIVIGISVITFNRNSINE